MTLPRARALCRWLILLVQLSAPVWVSLADAHALGPEPAVAHVEQEDCAPSHPLNCHLCVFLRAPAEAGSGPGWLPGEHLVREQVPHLQPSRPSADGSLSQLPRGPPASA